VTLQDELESALYKEARKLGEPVSVVREKFEAGDPEVAPAELLIDAIKRMAIEDARNVELEQAHQTIRLLRGQIDELESKLEETIRTSK
jgi:hypothetical protein